jgi:hypothetical protein
MRTLSTPRPAILLAGVVATAALLVVASAPASAARDRTPPTKPGNLHADAVTQTSVTLDWDPSTDNRGVTHYTVNVVGSGDPAMAVPHPQTTATVTGLEPGQDYLFQVLAWDAAWNYSWPGATVAVTTLEDLDSPTTPTDLTVVSVQGSTVRLQWTAGVDGGNPVRHHDVLVNGTSSPNTVSTTPPGTIYPPPIVGALVRQLEPATTYTFTVRARDGSGNTSAESDAVTATTAPNSDTVPPTTPVLTRASSGGTSYCPEEIEIDWNPATDDVDSASQIELEIRVNGVINEVVPNSWGDPSGLTDAIIYTDVRGANTLTLVAVDRAGNASPRSNAQTVQVDWGAGCE